MILSDLAIKRCRRMSPRKIGILWRNWADKASKRMVKGQAYYWNKNKQHDNS